MPNTTLLAQQLSLFRSRIQNRRFDDVTLRILESILVSIDVQSLTGVESALKQFMRDECLLIFGEITQKSVDIKLLCADFLIRVFAIIGDVESCLALRYEALVMRDEKTTAHSGLRVTYKEWFTFAEHSLENGFHSIANQACEKALACSEANDVSHLKMDGFFHDDAIKKIKKLKDVALLAISSQSVHSQAQSYLKQKEVEQTPQYLITSVEAAQSTGSSRFRSGIVKHNLRKLHAHQCT